jgi:hypothetical protein
MEIREIKPTAEAMFLLDKGDKPPVPITLTVKFVPGDAADDYIKRPKRIKDEAGKDVLVPQENKLSEILRAVLIDAVVGWDLTSGGEPIECTIEKKKELLPTILGLMIKAPEGAGAGSHERVLGWALLNFAGDGDNFLKN